MKYMLLLYGLWIYVWALIWASLFGITIIQAATVILWWDFIWSYSRER